MPYQLLYSKSAFEDVKKLDIIIKKRIKKKIENYSQNPLLHAKKLMSTTIGTYRWRIGNYRIVFDINGNKIIILRIGHRKEIYK